jgi:hypothetical protein
MNYVINQSTEVQERAGKSTIPVGINDNCELVSITKPTASNGKSYLCFLFKNEAGDELKHMEWDIDPARVNPKDGESQDEAVARRLNSMLIRLKHICTKFVPADQFSVQGANWDQLCDNLIAFMGTRFVGTKVRLKVVYSWNDYSSLPNFAPFIESMTINPTALRITSYDKMEKESASAQAEVNSTDESDLPF